MAGFNYTIVAADGKHASSIKAEGEARHIITDDERRAFGIGEKALKRAIGENWGKVPNDAYLHSPTPWGDLYKTQDWKQVTTVLRPIRAEITEVSSRPLILSTNHLNNTESSIAATFSTGVSSSETHTFSSSWSTGGALSVEESVVVSAMPEGVGASSTTTVSYTQNWGIGGSESKTVTVASDNSVEVTLPAHTEAWVELQASKGVLKARVEYVASLHGQVVANYNPTYKGHHFRALDVASVMASAGIKNEITRVEDLTIEYYSNTSTTVKDAKNDVLAVHDAEGRALAVSNA